MPRRGPGRRRAGPVEGAATERGVTRSPGTCPRTEPQEVPPKAGRCPVGRGPPGTANASWQRRTPDPQQPLACNTATQERAARQAGLTLSLAGAGPQVQETRGPRQYLPGLTAPPWDTRFLHTHTPILRCGRCTGGPAERPGGSELRPETLCPQPPPLPKSPVHTPAWDSTQTQGKDMPPVTPPGALPSP